MHPPFPGAIDITERSDFDFIIIQENTERLYSEIERIEPRDILEKKCCHSERG
jgi:isocitrate/isopropylmalate dehydrogenase